MVRIYIAQQKAGSFGEQWSVTCTEGTWLIKVELLEMVPKTLEEWEIEEESIANYSIVIINIIIIIFNWLINNDIVANT